jgi:hypothetical protein
MNNEITHAYIDHLKGRFGKRKFRKKPIVIEAYKINHDFHVKTMEGTMRGKAGDYVIIGIRGELYICDDEIFNETYEEVNESINE